MFVFQLFPKARKKSRKRLLFRYLPDKRGTLMDSIASSPGKWGLRYNLATKARHWWKGKMTKTCYMRFPVFTTELRGHVFFIYDFWRKNPKVHIYHVWKKNWHQVKARWISTCIKYIISKPSDTVLLCYLALDAFFERFFGEINLISVKIFISNHFLWSWTGFELDIETYYFDSLLELRKTRPPPPPPRNLQK